jgi:DnaJ like chaperone protein
MSIWGKIVGGAAGFALGGPLGGLVGAVAGHAIDRMRDSQPTTADETRQTAFIAAVIVLAAKMAKADGAVSRAEIDAFKRIFRVPAHEFKFVGALFDRARQDAAGYEPYARQIAALFRRTPWVLEELLDGLFEIAKADRAVHPAELAFLKGVGRIFGFDDAEFERIRASHLDVDEADPYEVLGLTPAAGDGQIKTTYRRLVREHHPDRLIAEGMPQEFIDIANDKLAAINGAYDRVRRQRGLK